MSTPRAAAQRERIIAAAQRCFEAEGFHGASMARIAATAGVSAGLLYRYFENKEAIIEAIVQCQVEAIMTSQVQQRPRTGGELARHLAGDYGQPTACGTSRGNPKLVLELSAEATRNPAIAAVVSGFDAALRRFLIDWLRAPVADGGRGMTEAQASERALGLQVLIEGLKVRETREPQLDRALLARTLTGMLTGLLDG